MVIESSITVSEAGRSVISDFQRVADESTYWSRRSQSPLTYRRPPTDSDRYQVDGQSDVVAAALAPGFADAPAAEHPMVLAAIGCLLDNFLRGSRYRGRTTISRCGNRLQEVSLAAAVLIVVGGGPARAQNGPPSPQGAPAPPPPPAFATSGPFSFTGAETADIIGNPTGGMRSGVKFLSKTALSASYDGAQDDHEGLSGLISAQYVDGGHISGRNVGDIQTLDNIEASRALRLYEAWLSRDYDNRRGWKVGLIDLNVDFDTQEVAALFINSSNGIGPDLSRSGLNGPSIYPTTALGVTAYFRPTTSLTVRAGIFDGTAGTPYHPGAFAIRLSGDDGALAIVQLEERMASGLRFEGGGWGYTAYFDAISRVDATGAPVRYQRARGLYGLVEGPILKDPSNDQRTLSGWIRIGTADPVVERVSGYIGAGLVYAGLLRNRLQDQVGVSINHAVVQLPQGPASPSGRKSAETAVEISYRYLATDWLAVQPDAQFVRHPAGDLSIADALVVGVRFTVTLTKTLLAKVGVATP